MKFRVLQDFDHHDHLGQPLRINKGRLVDIANRHEAKALLIKGVIGEKKYGTQAKYRMSKAAPAMTAVKRVGLWLRTTTYYSGGRLHLYQFATCLARLGVEVYFITNARPAWMSDYRKESNLFLLDPSQPIPEDLDVVVTDGKYDTARGAQEYKARNPHVPLVVWSFETPNWVKEFDPEYAAKLPDQRGLFKKAQLLIANSSESEKYLREFSGGKVPTVHLPPAVNPSDDIVELQTNRRFAIASSRAATHKGGNIIRAAIENIPGKFDLVVFGNINVGQQSPDHRVIALTNASDRVKNAYMARAHMVLAPSTFEGFGMVPMEALAAGTPCIVYDLPVLRQNYGDRLEYVPHGDEKAFMRRVLDLAKEEKQDVASAGKWARAEYSLDAMRKRVDALPYFHMKRPSISAHMICYWGFVPEALEAIYGDVDEIRVAFGPTEIAKGLCGPDGSLEKIQAFPDPEGKIKIEVREIWKNKLEMRQWGVAGAAGNHMLLLDGDEIWIGLDKLIQSGLKFGSPRWINLWHGRKHWIHDHATDKGTAGSSGSRWGHRLKPFGSVCPHYRWSWWRPSYQYQQHTRVEAAGKQRIFSLRESRKTAEAVPGCAIYHLGHSLPREVMDAKHQFYADRDGKDVVRQNRITARREFWRDWDGQEGDCGDGIIAKVDWPLPGIVRRALTGMAK